MVEVKHCMKNSTDVVNICRQTKKIMMGFCFIYDETSLQSVIDAGVGLMKELTALGELIKDVQDGFPSLVLEVEVAHQLHHVVEQSCRPRYPVVCFKALKTFPQWLLCQPPGTHGYLGDSGVVFTKDQGNWSWYLLVCMGDKDR